MEFNPNEIFVRVKLYRNLRPCTELLIVVLTNYLNSLIVFSYIPHNCCGKTTLLKNWLFYILIEILNFIFISHSK